MTTYSIIRMFRDDFAAGRIVKTGGPELALEVEHNGYADILAEGAA